MKPRGIGPSAVPEFSEKPVLGLKLAFEMGEFSPPQITTWISQTSWLNCYLAADPKAESGDPEDIKVLWEYLTN